jgi:hypothetical protein
MKFVFLAKYVQNHLCLVSIRKPESSTWYHFRRTHWLLKNHSEVVQLKVLDKQNFANYRSISVSIKKPDTILNYYNPIEDIFVFKGIELEKGN